MIDGPLYRVCGNDEQLLEQQLSWRIQHAAVAQDNTELVSSAYLVAHWVPNAAYPTNYSTTHGKHDVRVEICFVSWYSFSKLLFCDAEKNIVDLISDGSKS